MSTRVFAVAFAFGSAGLFLGTSLGIWAARSRPQKPRELPAEERAGPEMPDVRLDPWFLA